MENKVLSTSVQTTSLDSEPGFSSSWTAVSSSSGPVMVWPAALWTSAVGASGQYLGVLWAFAFLDRGMRIGPGYGNASMRPPNISTGVRRGQRRSDKSAPGPQSTPSSRIVRITPQRLRASSARTALWRFPLQILTSPTNQGLNGYESTASHAFAR